MNTRHAELTRTGLNVLSAEPMSARFVRRTQPLCYIEQVATRNGSFYTIHFACLNRWPLEPKGAGNSFLKTGGLVFSASAKGFPVDWRQRTNSASATYGASILSRVEIYYERSPP